MSSVGVTTTASICLSCKTQEKTTDFHNIFEADLEDIQLSDLILKYFGISVSSEKGHKQEICDECLNRLIELYDVEEHSKELKAAANDRNTKKEEELTVPICSIKEERENADASGKTSSKGNDYIKAETRELPPSLVVNKGLQDAGPQAADVEGKCDEGPKVTTLLETDINNGEEEKESCYVESTACAGTLETDTKEVEDIYSKVHQLQSTVTFDENAYEDGDQTESLAEVLAHQSNEEHKAIDHESEELSELATNFETELSNFHNLPSESYSVLHVNAKPINEENDEDSHLQQLSSENNNGFEALEESNNVEEDDDYNEDTYIESSPTSEQNTVVLKANTESSVIEEDPEYPDDSGSNYFLAVDNDEAQQEAAEMMVYEEHNTEDEGSDAYVEEIFCQNDKDDNLREEEEENTDKENSGDDENTCEGESAVEDITDDTLIYVQDDAVEFDEHAADLIELENGNDNESTNVYEEEQPSEFEDQTLEIQATDEISNDNNADTTDFVENEEYSLDATESNENIQDENYYIEEIITSVDYDKVDITEYLDNVIATNFDDLQVEWEVGCKLCLCKYATFQELLQHSCITELVEEEQNFSCIKADCNEVVSNLKTLARHLIIRHYKNIESLRIYGRCPDCRKPFSNIADFNKHSCSDIKRKPGMKNFCQMCNLHFQSLKRFVFHMQFHLSKHRPKVCVLCSSLFNNIDDFFEHVSYGHETEASMACIKCDRFFQDKDVFGQHVLSHENKYIFECPHCPKKYTNRSSLTSHMDIYHNHQMKPLQCDHCYKIFVNQASYRSHIKAHMPEAKITSFICLACGVLSNNEEFIQNHIENEETSPDDTGGEYIEKIISIAYTCECCSLDFFSPKHLQKHRNTPSHDDNLYCCPICRKTFKTLKHMRNHMTNHKDYDEWLNDFPIARFYMCNIGDCMDAYPLWSSLYYHKKRHRTTDAPSKFPCQFCEKVCETKMSLAVHIARVHNNNNIKCQHCQKSYKSEKDLKHHMMRMHITVQCSKCDKVFKNQRNLISHEQLVHENMKRYFCSHCEKGYYYQSELKAHEKNVHPSTTYNCKLCNFVTTYPKSLDLHHAAKHTDSLQFQCELCGKGFARKQLLVLHMKRHKDDKDFICYENCDDGCAASFINYFLLKKHIEEEHSSATWTEESGKKSRFQEKRKRKATETSSSSCSGGSKRKKREIVVVENNSGEVEFILGELVNNESQDAMSNDQESQDDDNRTPEEEEEQDDEEEILKAFEEEDLMDYDGNE